MRKKIPKILTDKERELLLKQPNLKSRTSSKGLKDLSLMLLMLNGGLRSFEALNVKIQDINWDSGQVKVEEGKGKKDRVVWLDEETIDTIKEYIQKRKIKKNLIFTTNKGNKIDTSYLRRMIKQYTKKVSLSNEISPHTLRHTFATDLLRKTKNIRLVQKALGHSNLSTTMVYTHIVDEELEDAMKTLRQKEEEK